MVEVRAFSTPKLGASEDENEDAFATNLESLSFAVSDGASEGVWSRVWAKQLARHFVENPFRFPYDRGFREWLPAFRPPELRTASPPWFLGEAERRGSFATLIGLAFDAAEPPGECSWVSYGDSGLFMDLRGRWYSVSPPMGYDFQQAPHLLPTNPPPGWRPRGKLGFRSGLSAGDRIVLATDAVAAWLQARLACHDSLRPLLECQDQAEFDHFVGGERARGGLRNDDVTMLAITLTDELQVSQGD